MVDKFRLESIVIEGFKGFTSPQEIKLNGKSTFIFGPNGWGKTSILEAISWCMFGLDRKNESEIRNRDYYVGDSKVEITLVRNEEIWKVIRKLRPDSGRADAKIISPQGEEKKLSEIFPQLTKLGGIGANVLFAQQGTKHKFVGDLNKFKDVIDAYLGLDRLEKLRKLLLDEEKDQKENHYEKQIRRNWGEFEKSIDGEIQNVENKLTYISSNPPWQGITPPTESETKMKVVNLHRNVGNFLQVSLEDSVSNLQIEEILDKIRSMLESPSSVGKLNDAIKQKKSFKSSVEDMKAKYEDILNSIEQIKNKCKSCETELNNLLSVETEEESKKRVESLEDETDNLRLELETAISVHKEAEETRIIGLPTIESEIQKLNSSLERLAILKSEISKCEQELATLTAEIPDTKLTDQLEGLENQEGKLGEHSKLITAASEYCSKYAYANCPICESNSDFIPKLSRKVNTIPQEISSVTMEIKSLSERIQIINETKRNLSLLKSEHDELVCLIPENPNQRLKTLEDDKQSLLQEEEIARNIKKQLSKEVPEKRENVQTEINSIRQSLEKVTSLRTRIQNYEIQLKSFDDDTRKIEDNIRSAFSQSVDTIIELNVLEDEIHNIGSEILDSERELNENTSGLNTYKSRIKELKREAEYHRLLKLSTNFSELKSGEDWQNVEQLIYEFLELLNSLEEISDALSNTYKKAFNEHLTAINQKVHEVYRTLTAQLSYPDAKVSQISSDSESIEIVIEVGVSGEEIWRKPTEVLNEQARNAVVLVPYFAFSELGMLQHDLDFLLIDDPSRSFDIKHLESLMKLFKSVSEHAQVILATHEKEKFEGPVRDLFGANANILEVVDFEPKSGPKLKEVSI